MEVWREHPNYSTGAGGPYCQGCEAPIKAFEGNYSLGWVKHVAEVAASAERERIAREIEADLLYDDAGRLNAFNAGQEYAARLVRGEVRSAALVSVKREQHGNTDDEAERCEDCLGCAADRLIAAGYTVTREPHRARADRPHLRSEAASKRIAELEAEVAHLRRENKYLVTGEEED
ncbi:hypothetical protein EDD28_0041 [Salana multivorans]|uniref:Uncharacterized protein n=1 Tax=Salana multivorans TaxID=120377 RepID=A0A3N2D757_9MICO|nr:hypothetical protein [Salana multivorans]ROR95488.1 hypothetical protein EDD28_0041 [Salana multivorans]